MRIKKRLYINAVVSMLIALVIGLVLSFSLYRLNRANNFAIISGELLTAVLERVVLRNDYIRNNSARAKEQWFIKNALIGGILKSALENFRDAGDKKIIAGLLEEYESFGRIFSAIVANREKNPTTSGGAEFSPAIEERLLNQLNLRVYEAVDKSHKLQHSSVQARAAALKFAGGGVVAALLLLIATAMINAGTLGRAITERVGRLRDGAALIGGVDLDHRIDLTGDDEFAELSESFNTMIAKLSVTYQELANEIGERKRAEAALQKLNEELELRVAERTENLRISMESLEMEITNRKRAEKRLQSTLLEVERSNRELEQFAYVASHDLQEPLRMVSSYTQLLAQRYEGQLDDKAKKFINYAVDGAVRMQRLINDLLAYSRVSSLGKPLDTVDAHAVLGEALRNLGAAIQESLALILNDDLPTVRADALQLGQLFQNLIANAIKFKGADLPRIHVSARDLGQEWCFAVTDNGIGIDMQYADKVFVIFQRLHTRVEYPGTGIGLAICKRIVERHHGRIWFESEPGKGATFYFTLPK